MQTVLGWLLAPLKWLAGLLLPIFKRPNIPPAVFWLLHLLILLAIFAGLYYLEHHSPYKDALEAKMPAEHLEFIRKNYLIIFAALIYALSWLAVWLWKIWLEEDISQGDFPDIDAAWAEIQQALHQNGIRLDDAPLYLVVGHAELPTERLFRGLPRECTLTGATSATAPLRAFGGRDALYITCPGVSLLSKALGYGPADVAAPTDLGPGRKTIGADDDLTKSIGADAEEVARIVRAAQREGRPVSEQERHQIRNISMSESGLESSLQTRPHVVQSPEAVSLQEARLTYFCRILAKARTPYCPINGAILLFSLNVSNNEGDSQKIALAAQKDLKTLSATLKLHFPTFVVLADVDRWPGAAAFLARFPEDRRGNRLGRGFPLAPDLTVEQFPAAVQTNVQWVFEKLLPYWCFRFFRLETPNLESPEEAIQINGEIFRFLSESQQRAGCIARMVAKAVQTDDETLSAMGGCYLVAQSSGAPWFTQDLFAKVEAAQNYVSWSQSAFDEDDDYKAWTWYGYGFLLLVWIAVAGLAYLWYSQQKSQQ